VKSEVQSAIADLKKAIEGNDIEAIKTASEHAAQASQKMGTAIYAAAQAERQASSGAAEDGATAETPQDEGVVDAEIVDEGEGESGAAR
jgi:molecular chaperone DnaK